MTFSEGGQFEGGRVRRGGGGRAGIAAGGLGGGAVVLVLLVSLLTGQDPGQLLGALGGTTQQDATGRQDPVGDCTAAEANTDRECRLSAATQSMDAFWGDRLPAAGIQAELPEVVSFSSSVRTACGSASAAIGPFYCPGDATVYIDVSFYDVLTSQLGARGGSLAEMYILAHEYGHHVQHLTGAMESADRRGTGADSDSVRLELQADCYAGMWVGDAASREDPDTGVTFLDPITADELADALSAAEAVGDDEIQSRSGGIDPDSWTHGSAKQRQAWFTTGYEQGSLTACDTFAARTL